MTCKNEFQMNETAAEMMHSDAMMKEVSQAIWRLNEWADCTDGVPVDLGYIMNQPEMALQNQPIFDILESVRLAMRADAAFIVPVEFPPGAFGIGEPGDDSGELRDPLELKPGDEITAEEEIRVKLHSLPVDGGGDALVGFTSYEELEAGPPVSSIRVGVEQLLHMTLMSENFEGLAINPWGNGFYLPKDYIAMIFRADELLEEE